MTTKNKLIDDYDEWLSRFKWQWLATLTFWQSNISPSRADDLFDRWIFQLQDAEGTRNFHWFRVTERGANGDHLRFHCLVGGLENASKWPWLLLWDELAGDCLISYRCPFGGTLRYLLKEVRSDHDLAIECDYDFNLPNIW